MRYVCLLLSMVVVPTTIYAQDWDSLPRLTKHYEERVVAFTREKPHSTRAAFLGDDLMEHGNWVKLLGDSTVINRGIAGDVTFGTLKRLVELKRFSPANLVIEVGTGDLINGVPEEIVMENIFLLISRCKRTLPNTRLFVLSLVPVKEVYPQAESVGVINTQLSRIQSKFGYTYIDLNKFLLDSAGRLKRDCSADENRLTAEGYRQVVQALKEGKFL